MLKTAPKALRYAVYGLLTIVLLEMVLQLAGLWVKEQSWRAQKAWLTNNTVRILALGDSNTYGLYLPAAESYPAQLQQQWNLRYPNKTIEVINLGYPGTNSFRLLANLPQVLNTLQPDIVLLMIGFNDFWTPVENLQTDIGSPWLQKSRLYKLFYMLLRKQDVAAQIDSGERQLQDQQTQTVSEAELRFIEQTFGVRAEQLQQWVQQAQQQPQTLSVEVQQQLGEMLKALSRWRDENKSEAESLFTVKVGEEVFSLGIQRGEPARHSRHLEQNLQAMLDLLQAHTIPVLVMNYPSRYGFYPQANKKISQFMQEQPVSSLRGFVDLSHIFPDQCAEQPDTCPDLLFYDAHATAAGNEMVAEKVGAALEQMLLVH